MYKLFKLSLIVLINFFLLSSANAQWIKLHGMVENKMVKLYWETHDWPEDLYGFNIKRIEEGTDEWVKLNKEVISPQFNENNYWSNQGMNNEQTAYIKEKFEEYIDLGKVQLVKNEQFLKLLKNAGGLKSGDRIRMKNDFDLAFIAGFGFIDNIDIKDKKYTYGIFYVQDGGKEKAEPEATFSIINTDKLQIDQTFEKAKKGINISWTMSSKEVRDLGMFGFNIYRSKKGIKSLEILNKRPLGSVKTENDTLVWNYQDNQADNSKDYIYAIAPVNMFQKEIKRFVKKYNSKKFQILEIPSIDTLHLVNDIQVLVKWRKKFTKKELKRIKELKVERTESNKLLFKPISNILAGDSYQFIDSIKKEYGKIYVYRLVVVDKNNKKWYSKTKSMLFLGEPKPPKPANARAEFKMIGETPNIVLSWDSKLKNDSLTKGYIISTDELKQGVFLRLASLSIITKNNYTYQLNTNGGREFQFKIIPVSIDGVHGPVAVVKYQVPLINVPSVTDFIVSLTDNSKIKLKWNFPDNTPVKGFNIKMNGKIIATYQDVDSTYREWTITNSEFEKEGVNGFVIQSVGEFSISDSPRKTLYLKNRAQKMAVLKPENLNATIIKEKNEVNVLLKWNKINFEKEDILGFVLYVDDKEEGILMKQAALPLIKQNEYLFKIKDTGRKRFTFGIAAMNKERIVGYYTKIEVDLSKKKKSK